MNIENILALADQLEKLGFNDLSYSLLKRICFQPENFGLSQRIEIANTRFSFHLAFAKEFEKDIYVLQYYDATLQNEIKVTGLKQQMQMNYFRKSLKNWFPDQE